MFFCKHLQQGLSVDSEGPVCFKSELVHKVYGETPLMSGEIPYLFKADNRRSYFEIYLRNIVDFTFICGML